MVAVTSEEACAAKAGGILGVFNAKRVCAGDADVTIRIKR